MTRKSKRELERALEDLSEGEVPELDDVELTDKQAEAVREYTLHCDSPADLDDDLEAALREVAE